MNGLKGFLALMLSLSCAGCFDGGSPNQETESPGQETPSTGETTTVPASQETTASGAQNTNRTQGPPVFPWELIDCHFAYATMPADANKVSERLPEGFRLAAIGPKVMIGFEINECTSGSGFNATVTPQTYASIWVGVAPPQGLGEDGIGHFVNFDVLVQDEERRQVMQQHGVPAHDGSITTTRLPDGSFSAEYTLEDVGTFTLTAAPGRPTVPAGATFGGAFDQWTPGTCGLTYWRTDYIVSEQTQSAATMLFEPSNPYAEWFDTPAIAGTVNYGRWNYENGTIMLPPLC